MNKINIFSVCPVALRREFMIYTTSGDLWPPYISYILNVFTVISGYGYYLMNNHDTRTITRNY